MNKKILKIITFLISLILIVDMFFYCSMTVYAFPSRLKDGTWVDKPWSEAAEEIWLTIQYGLCQMGVFFCNGADFKQWLKNTEDYQDLWDENGRLAKNVSIDTETGNVTYTKEIMTVLKSAADDYAKEHEPYSVVTLQSYRDIDPATFSNKGMYNTICNLAKEHGLISVNDRYIANLSDVFKNGYAFVSRVGVDFEWSVKAGSLYIYDSDWIFKDFPVKEYPFGSEPIVYTSYEQLNDLSSNMRVTTHNAFIPNDVLLTSKVRNASSSIGDFLLASLISKDRMRIRVYNTLDDYKRYSVGKRSVYYTENYYNYVPEDLTVTIDDLEKAVDDLQKVIDELLKQIQDDTSEKEIEDLLRQILEEIRNGQGTGGGGGSGGGDVTVDIDLSTTNGLLSKILTKVTQIFDKLSSSAGKTMDDVVTSIDDLGKMLKKYLSEITGDLDDIKGQLEQISEQEFSEKSDSFLDSTKDSFSEIGEAAKDKFPFSIPDDMRKIVSVLSQKPPEPETKTYSAKGNTLYGMSTGDSDIIMITEGSETYSSGWSETGAPVFNLPIVIKSLGWNYAIVVDLSNFQSVANLCRTYMTLVYIWALLMLSIKIVGLWGELVD